MKRLSVAVFAALLFGCLPPDSDTEVKKEEVLPGVKVNTGVYDGRLVEVEYDNCQYLVFDGYNKGNVVHKANCSNSIHR